MTHRRASVARAAALAIALAACARPPAAAPRHAPPEAAPRAAPSPPPDASALVPGGALRVRFLDVGQGDAAVVTTDDGASAAIDLGPREASTRIERELSALPGLSAVIVTHAHADHLGELDRLAQTARIGVLWEPGFADPRPTATYPRALAAFESRGVPRVVARRGMHLRMGAHVDLEVLAPREPLLRGTRSDPNANSVVVRLSHPTGARTVRVLFTGDAEAPTEERLLESPDQLAADVLKVAHHGSRHASSARFLSAVGAKIGVISCARGNDYGHPHAATLRRLASAGVEVHRTDVEGDVTIESAEGRLTATPARPASAEDLARPGRGRGDREAP